MSWKMSDDNDLVQYLEGESVWIKFTWGDRSSAGMSERSDEYDSFNAGVSLGKKTLWESPCRRPHGSALRIG